MEQEKEPEPSYEPPKTSFSDVIPRYGYGGQKGLGGSDVTVGQAPVQEALEPSKVDVTPQALMQRVQDDEDHMLRDRPDADAVSTAGFPAKDAPEWLQQYMARQPISSIQQMPMGGVDRFEDEKYLSEKQYREQLKKLRDQKPGR